MTPVAFGTAVGMWAVGYLSHLPWVPFPKVALGLLLLLQIWGGRAGGLHHQRRVLAGLGVGFLSSVLHLLILGSFLTEPGGPEGRVPLQIAGFLVLGTLLGGIGGVTARGAGVRPLDGVRAFTRIAAGATFLLVVIGGIVTSSEAGLAVPDWPTSFEANMFLLPFSRMVSESGVYYEHAHRLFGVLVGLTVLALTLYLWRYEPRRWVRCLGLLALLAVIGQGILGGIRVEAAESGVDNTLSLALRVIHGVSGQLLFGFILVLVAFTSRTWRSEERLVAPTVGTEIRLAATLIAALVGQLVLGALLRHVSRDWDIAHITGSILVAALAVLASVRGTGLYPKCPPVRGTGLALLFLVVLQLMLGFLAYAVTGTEVRTESSGPFETWVATSHQATGALLLGAAAVHLVWVGRRLGAGDPAPETGPAGAA